MNGTKIWCCVATLLGLVACGGPQDADMQGEATAPGVAVRGDALVSAAELDPAMPANTLALTYDDGPDVHTLELAQYLHDQGIPATFFIVGCRIQGHDPGVGMSPQCDGQQYPPSLLGQLVALGHRIGNHSSHHRNLAWLASQGDGQTIHDELADVQRVLDPYITDGVKVMRAPGHAWSGVAAYVHQYHDLDALLGSYAGPIDAADWACAQNGSRTVAQCAEDYVRAVRGTPTHSGIVQLHDRLEFNPGSDYALRLTQAIVSQLRTDPDRTYAFVTLGPDVGGPSLGALSLSPAAVPGGQASQGAVTLTGQAPAGGIVVALASSSAGLAQVPASVSVPAGATTATFPITTGAVSANTDVTITATLGASRTATLTVTPRPGAPVAQLALVSDAAGGQTATGWFELFYLGRSGALYHRYKTEPAGSWSAEAVMGGWAKQLTAGRDADGRLETFYVGGDNAIWQNWQTAANGAWHGEARLGGQAKQIAVGRNADGRLDVFFIGTDDRLYHFVQTVPNGGWRGPFALGGAARQLVVGQNADGRLELIYIGMDGTIWQNWQTAPSGAWNGERQMGGLAKQLAVGRNADGRLEVFYIGADDAVWHRSQTVANGGWGSAASLGGRARQLAVGRNADGRLDAFYIGMNNAVWHRAQTVPNGGWGAEASLGGRAKQLVVGLNADGRLEVLYVGMDDFVWHRWQTTPNGGWGSEAAL